MKFKPTHTRGKVLVELDEKDSLPLPGTIPPTVSPSFKLKRILVPIDFSDSSKKALAYAVPYAKEFGASITLLYVAEFFWAGSEMDSAEVPAFENRAMAEAKAKLLELAKEIPSDIKVEPVVLSGRPFLEIIAAADELRSDLIIIATHGAHRPHTNLGSTTERVARHANCPVLIVRPRERDFVAVAALRRKNPAP